MWICGSLKPPGFTSKLVNFQSAFFAKCLTTHNLSVTRIWTEGDAIYACIYSTIHVHEHNVYIMYILVLPQNCAEKREAPRTQRVRRGSRD